MANQTDRGFNIGHPTQDSGTSRLLWVGLVLAPLAWIVQLLASFELSNRACRDEMMSSGTAPDWLGTALTAINIVALVLALVAITISWRNMRHTHRSKTGPHGILGSGGGQTRFLAVWGILTGLMFLFAIAFNTFSLYLVPLCNS
jgi:hypothetical protein